MKGHMEDGKFHPHTQTKGVRKSRDQQAKTEGVRFQRERTTNSELKEQIDNLNRKISIDIEYGDVGGEVKGLKVKGTGTLIKIMSKKEAVNCLKFTSWILDRQMESSRFKRDENTGVKLDDKQKTILRNWVKQNRDWTTIDDLPNEIFIPLVAPAGDDIDKRVAIQIQAIDFMKKVTEGIKHIEIIKNELKDNLIKMKKNPDDLNITKERDNLHKQLKQLRKKHNYYEDQS